MQQQYHIYTLIASPRKTRSYKSLGKSRDKGVISNDVGHSIIIIFFIIKGKEIQLKSNTMMYTESNDAFTGGDVNLYSLYLFYT